MRLLAKPLLLLFLLAAAGQSRAAETFMPAGVDAGSGEAWLEVPAWNSPFLMVVTLENALGSNDIGLDRAQNGEPKLVEFRRFGTKVLLVQRNTRFVANSTDADEAKAATDAFAESVLWAGTLNAGNRTNIGSLLLSDLHGVGNRLKQTQQGGFSVDSARSAVIADAVRSFPDNTEFSALLTFKGSGEGRYVRQIAADPEALTVKQRVSFVRLPPPGFTPRAYHPGSGGYSIGYFDFARPIHENLDVRWQPRFRLQKTDPNAARSTVVKPIVFYLDRGTPEPIRSALLEGANWWSEAFDAAGFIGGFRAELAPPGMNMSDVRYNTITWTHRATRGWSYGGGLIDPRTGEILKGYVNLGSQRVRQDLLIAESLLAPYGKNADPALQAEAQAMALARLRQLAAHEVGHALGFAHNFAASRTATGSVLDYPHPQISMDAQGRPRLQGAYAVGVGDWDRFIVAHAYGQFPAAQEQSALAQLRAAVAAKGYRYASDPDSRQPEDSHDASVLWDIPGEPLRGLEHLMAIRKAALARFADGALPPDREVGEAERRLVPLYLLHRYQSEAVIRLIGGSDTRYGVVSDSLPAVRAVSGTQQQQALQAAAGVLGTEVLTLPDSILAVLQPPSNEYSRTREDFETRMAPLFDPMQAAASATALIADMLFAPERINRLAWQHSQDNAVPSVDALLDRGLVQFWLASGNNGLIAQTRNGVLLDAALLSLDSGKLQPAVAVQWRQALAQFAKQLRGRKDPAAQQAADWIQAYLSNPSSVKLRALPLVPPGSPI